MTAQHVADLPAETDAVVLARLTGDTIDPADFAVERRPVVAPGPGEVVVHNLVTSVDPYHLRMLRGGQGHGGVGIGDVVPSNCVGVVVASNDPHAPIGTQVATYTGWTEYATTTLAPTDVADRRLGDELDWIHVLGTPGVTAYLGLHDVGGVRGGSTVVVSAAAGAVGGVAVQLAKAAGARVVAIAGGSARAEHTVRDLGADVGLDHTAADLVQRLAEATDAGADLFFDNVGGALLPTVVDRLAPFGTAVLCGSVSTYAGDASGRSDLDLSDAAMRRLTIRGFIAGDYYESRLVDVREELSALLRSGTITNVVTEFDGLKAAPEALASVFERGTTHVGKRVVRIA